MFLLFKGATHAYLGKRSMAHNKRLILINRVYARSAPQILFLKDEYTFPF